MSSKRTLDLARLRELLGPWPSAVIITTANLMSCSGPDTIESVDRRGNARLIEAAAGAGVRRCVFISALGADPNHPMSLLRAKGECLWCISRVSSKTVPGRGTISEWRGGRHIMNNGLCEWGVPGQASSLGA